MTPDPSAVERLALKFSQLGVDYITFDSPGYRWKFSPKEFAEWLLSHGVSLAPTEVSEAGIEAALDAIPRWYEVDGGGEIFGWRIPDAHGRSVVICAPASVEEVCVSARSQLRAILAAARGPEERAERQREATP